MKKFKSLSLLLAVLYSLLPVPLYCQWLDTTVSVGDNPWDLVYNSTNNKVYCANLYGDNVTVIDGKYNSVITTITVGDRPYSLVYNSLNNKVYCANNGSDNVTVIDGASNSVITTIPVGDRPFALVYNFTNNKVYCANALSSTLTVIGGTSDSVITTIPVGYFPYDLIYNSMNKKVYCANGGGDDVTVIDGASDSVIKTITVGGSPGAFAWNPIQNRIYVANYWSNTVSVIRDTIPYGIEERQTLDAIRLTPEIYPNPAQSVIRVRGPFSEKTIKMFDVSGKLIRVVNNVTSAQEHKQEIRISLKGINPGIYFLRLGKETKKFLVVK
jgi:YVTN family beta-propeller protein